MLLARKERTRETFVERISRKAKSTQMSYNTVLNNWESFSEEKFQQKDIIPDLKLVDEETLWDTLQSWINWNSERENMPKQSSTGFRF